MASSMYILVFSCLIAISLVTTEAAKCEFSAQVFSTGDPADNSSLSDIVQNGFIEVQGDRLISWEGVPATNEFAYAIINNECKVEDKGTMSVADIEVFRVGLDLAWNFEMEEGWSIVAASKDFLADLDFTDPEEDDLFDQIGLPVPIASKDEDASAYGGPGFTGFTGANDVAAFVFAATKGTPESSTYKLSRNGFGPRLVVGTIGSDAAMGPTCPPKLPPFSVFREEVQGLLNADGAQMAIDDGSESWAAIDTSNYINCEAEVRGVEFYSFSTGTFYVDLWRYDEDDYKLKLLAQSEEITPSGQTMDGTASYHCFANPVSVSAGTMFGVHYPVPRLNPSIYRSYSYDNAMKYPCSEFVNGESASKMLVLEYFNETMASEFLILGFDTDGPLVNIGAEALGIRIHSQAFGLRPIIDQGFVNTCGCTGHPDCQANGDQNMMCVSGQCQCDTGYTYNRKHNLCLNSDFATTKPVFSSSATSDGAAGNAMDTNVSPVIGEGTCAITNRGSSWLVVDMEYEIDLYSIFITPPLPLDTTAIAYDSETPQYLDREVNSIFLTIVDRIVTNGPWPWLLESASGDTAIINRELKSSRQELYDDTFGAVSTSASIVTRLVYVGYFMDGDNCFIASTDGITLGTTDCTVFYITGDFASGYQIKKLNDPNIDYTLNLKGPLDGDDIVLGPDSTTVQFHVSDVNTDRADALKTDFKIILGNINKAITVNNGKLVLGDPASAKACTFKYHENLDATRSRYTYDTRITSTTSGATMFDFSGAGSNLCVEVLSSADTAIANGGAVVSKSAGVAYIDAFKIRGRDNPPQYLETVSAQLTARAIDVGLYDFSIGVAKTFDGSNFDASAFNVCTSYPAHPIGGLPNRYDCDNVYSGRYVAIWMDSLKYPTSQIKICDLDIHVLSKQMIGKRCVNDSDCLGKEGSDQHLYCEPASKTCQCEPGFYYWEPAKLCVDYDECGTAENNTCFSSRAAEIGYENGTCVNMLGSYRCDCPDGMLWNQTAGGCEDIDETMYNNCGCEDRCENRFTDNSTTNMMYECYCDSPQFNGFQLGNNKHSCEDINECEQDNTTCGTIGICTNTVGSYRCSCPRYYQWDTNVIDCVDIDECSRSDMAGCEGNCTNKDYNTDNIPYICDCDNISGYELAPDRHGCIDDNECLDGTDDCRNTAFQAYNESDPQQYVQGECRNHVARWSCMCPYGYTWNDTAKVCQDDNECEMLGVHECEHNCINEYPSYSCSCREGYKLQYNKHSCTDINECNQGERDELATLGINITMSCYDADEMQDGIEDSMCVNTMGSYECRCPEVGYILNNETNACEDFDECMMNNGYCSHRCENKYMDRDNMTHMCSCPNAGLKLSADYRTCVDINECSGIDLLNHTCNAGTNNVNEAFVKFDVVQGTCVNSIGSYHCMCPSGYLWQQDQHYCQDIDECNPPAGYSPCEHTCENRNGSYSCSCNTGYTLQIDKKSCQDIDECASGANQCEQLCNNQLGSYTCACRPGYVLNADGISCDNVDECATNNGGCMQLCTDTVGSYTCSCRDPYFLMKDRHSCDDKDECVLSADNNCQQICVNTVGSYRCSCNAGYKIAADGFACEDVNECSAEYNNGGCEHTCSNTDGSFTCSCNTGYTLATNRLNCQDVDECVDGLDDCSDVCVNTPGSYICLCDGASRIGVENNRCFSGSLARFTICLDQTTFEETLYEMSNPDTRALASAIETGVGDVLYTESSVARAAGFSYQVISFFICENTLIGAELAAFPRSPVSDEDIARFAAMAANALPNRPNLVRIPSTGNSVGLTDKPEFVYSGNDGTRTFEVNNACDWYDNIGLCSNGGTCNQDDDNNLLCSCKPGYEGPRCTSQIKLSGLTTIEIGMIAGFAGLTMLAMLLGCCLCWFLGNNRAYEGGDLRSEEDPYKGSRIGRYPAMPSMYTGYE